MKKLKIRPFMIFNGEYENSSMNREGVNNTEELMEETFFDEKYLNLDRSESKVIVNGNRTNVLKSFREFVGKIDNNSEVLLFYYGGHGCADYMEHKLYLAMYDTDFEHVQDDAIVTETISKIIHEYHICYYVIILDCCHAGMHYSMEGSTERLFHMDLGMYNESKGSLFIPTSEELNTIETREIDGKHYLLFSYYFFNVLKEGIANECKMISFAEIYSLVKEKLQKRDVQLPVFETKGDLYQVGLWENIKYRKLSERSVDKNNENQLKVLLVKSAIEHPIKFDDFGVPLGLWLLKGYIDSYCMDLQLDIYDERLELVKCKNDVIKKEVKEQFEKIIKEYDVIGISMSSSEVIPALKKFKIAKTHEKVTIAGGIFTSSNEEYLLSSGLVDYVTPGIGATSLRKLLEWLLKQKKNKRINEKNNEISGVATIQNLDDFFVPSDDGLPNMTFQIWQEIVAKYKAYLYSDDVYKIDIYSTRGCKGTCTFCSVQKECGRRINFRSIETVIDEVKFLYKKGFTYFSLKDEDCFADQERFMRFLKSVQLPKIQFKIRTRVDHLIDNKEMLEELKSLGVVEIQYGIESSSYMILSNISKGIKRGQIDKVKSFIKLHSDLGIVANCSFILGLEGESEEYYDELLDFVKEVYDYKDFCKPKIYINFLAPHPRNSSFPVTENFHMVTNDLNYFTHKYPIGFYSKFEITTRQKMIETYEEIIEYTNSKMFNPSLKTQEQNYEYLDAFIVGNKYILDKPELPRID